MTVDVASRTRRRAPRAKPAPEPTVAPAASYAIGEIDQTVFDCPACARPLALGARRCPGCRTRLVNGVTLGKASLFASAGLAVGLVFGAGGGLLLGHGGGAPSNGGVVPGASLAAIGGGAGGGTAPSTAPSATPAPASPSPIAVSDVPPVTRSALGQAVATNGRLVAALADLRAELATRPFDASAVAQTLRGISADSIYGQQLADRVATWPAAGALGSRLQAFYDAIHETAADGLVASVRNEAAYRSAASAMVALLGDIAAVDAAVRAAAASAGVEIPAASPAPAAP